MTLPTVGDMDHAGRLPRPRFDGTINVPTLLMLLAMIGSAVGSSVAIYGSLDKRIAQNSTDIQLIREQQNDARLSSDISLQETKGALLRMDSKLDRLLWDRGDTKGAGGRPPSAYP